MAISRKTLKDTVGTQSNYDATSDVFTLVKSGGGDTIYVESTSDNFKVRYIGNTLVMKGEDGQIIKINIAKPAAGTSVVDTISFLDGDIKLTVIADTKGKISASLDTTPNAVGAVPVKLKLTNKFVDFALDLSDSGTGSGDHFTGVSAPTGPGTSLTEETDIVSGNIFDSGLVYTPGGNDRINALQDEDSLTGTGTNPTLNLTLGNHNDNGSNVVTPELKNIQTVNVNFTGSANTLDLRHADSIATLSVNRITAAAGNSGTFQNISQAAANLEVKDTSKAFVDVNFYYAPTVLDGTTAGADGETGTVKVKDVNLYSLYVGDDNSREGFETLTLNSTGTNVIKSFNEVDLENLTITGSGTLNLLSTDANDGLPGDQRINFSAGAGLAIGDGLGIRKIDASAYTGTLNLDITNAVGGHTDPVNSGVKFYTDIKGGTGNDTFWTGNPITGESAALHDKIDGGAGTNVLRAYNSIVAKDYYDAATDDIAAITKIQTLEIRESGVVADMDAFDANLTKVLMRDEHAPGPVADITVLNIGTTLATSGNLELHHAQDGEGATNPNLFLKSASGVSDTVKVTVVNDFNTEFQYDYDLNIDGNPYVAALLQPNEKVENVTIADNDTESNKVSLLAVDTLGDSEHTGTILLTGGTAGKFFEISSTLIATTIDAASTVPLTQASDLRLTVGTKDQTIKLGTGNDILTFKNLDDFNTSDTLTDAGGTGDTVRAAFSKDVSGTPALTGIEKLHIAATESMSMNLASATGISELAILSDQAVSGDSDVSPITSEPFGITGVETTDIITLQGTSISTLNFFADNDNDDALDGDLSDGNPFNASETPFHVFNGVTLTTTATTLNVAINSSLDKAEGADSYSIGQLTAAGVTTMNITVGDERGIQAGMTSSSTSTSINNMSTDSLATLTVVANGNVALGDITGSGFTKTTNSINTTGVKGFFSATSTIMGDGATVNLGNGGNAFNALNSTGVGIIINGGSWKDTLGGTDQADTLNGNAGDDTLAGYRGGNTINAGAGDDIASAQDASDAYNMGSGTLEIVTDNFNTGLPGGTATSTNVSMAGSAVKVFIDANGDGVYDVTQMVASGDGVNESVSWTLGSTFTAGNMGASTGVLASVGSVAIPSGATMTGTANTDFLIADDAVNAINFTGNNGADTMMVLLSGAGWATARTFDGGAGNDAFVGSTAGDNVTGGAGADRIVLSCNAASIEDNAVDTVIYAAGESTSTAWDTVYGFEVNWVTATNDLLNVTSLNLATPVGYTNNVNIGTGETGVGAHSIDANHLVSFYDAQSVPIMDLVGTGTLATTGNDQISLANALSYLSSALNGTTQTAVFLYDRNGDGSADDTFVFQDGGLSADTVVQLVGVQAWGVGTAAAVNMVQIS